MEFVLKKLKFIFIRIGWNRSYFLEFVLNFNKFVDFVITLQNAHFTLPFILFVLGQNQVSLNKEWIKIAIILRVYISLILVIELLNSNSWIYGTNVEV